VADSILLIDHDADVLRAVGDYFEGIGYEVGRAAAAEAGFEAFDRMRPDVVILDLHLPDLAGLDVLEQLRSQGGSVILLTGQGDLETAVRAMQLGAEHFVTKPVDLSHLAAATARVCDKVRLARQNALLREALDRLLRGAGGAGGAGAGGDGRHKPLALAEVERVHIEKTLRFHGGNRTRAAHELGISRATLINKIKVYGLDI
jgi:DNA-binding NtrC family response regulator